jgi:hypothetical protein
MKRVSVVVVLALGALVVPAAAKSAKHAPPPAAKPHKCVPHGVAYIASGALVSGSLTLNPDGTYSGTLTVHVTKTNHHARADKGTDKSYTLDHAKAKLHGETGATLTAGSRVKLRGKITTLAKKCDQTGFTPTITIKKADIKPPKPVTP